MVRKTTSKRYSVALVILMVIYVAFSFVYDRQLFRSLSFSQGTLQQTWESRRIKQAYSQPQETTSATITCDRSHSDYDLCSINGSCILDPKTGTFTLMDPAFATSATLVEKIRPYPRKAENWTMPRIKELTLSSGPLGLTRSCDITHDSPAIVFSAGGYTGSIYHDFMDGFIPLFITANSVYPDRDFILVVVNSKEWWMPKYIDILGAFSKHKTILLDKESASFTHCFPSVTVGLVSHGPKIIDPTQIPNSKSLVDFHNLLDKALNTNQSPLKTQKPRLILVSRYGNIGRVILNEKEIKEMLEDVGFEVITFRPSKTTSLREAYKLIKSSHVMVGVHGAALTHLLFLRPGSMLVQVVPLGLGWASKTCYESPAKAMKLEYIEYRVNVEESSLIEKYNRDDLVLKDPIAYRGMDWNVTKMKVYLKEQDVRLDVNRFRKHMNEAYEKAKLFMDLNG
ncbi:Glycosyltransferase 61 [Arabidopsis thaliana x Arabidopsis arenosa]|uniref:Glycosyltransferase 61 n=1 Tax=Arabidopsis thaliana x Arabidopsis arenosa TaxID=1240361 RepID=A0A8T1ZGP0_9BRAS|nr:Glycosyltransferase 61 [Arabidopsis thaliana x Arabidopsis arenosa]